MPRSAVLLLVVGLMACGDKQGPPAAGPIATGAPDAAGSDARWVDASGGLELRLELPTAPQPRAATVVATLRFRNRSTAPIRLYLLGPEVFRGGQSNFLLRADERGPVLSAQPEPLPHGYLPTEEDFPLIAAGGELTRKQTIQLAPGWLPPTTGELRVSWTYRNNIDRWPGGAQTLDGPTTPLFGGGPIPHIWRGEGRTSGRLLLAP